MAGKWWQQAVIYQIYPKSFQDSNHDGIGDIQGIIQRLEHIADLGINTIWLNPIYTSPQVDNGYDVSDYTAIDPVFGTMTDVEQLIQAAHDRGIRVIFDFVLNHTSNQHIWFQKALEEPASDYHDYYVWQETPGGGKPNNWGSFFGGSVWEYVPSLGKSYFHLFAKEMPDLNWQNPQVREEMFQIAAFWAGKGVDGFRLDAFIHIAKADFSKQMSGEETYPIAEPYYANLPAVKVYLAEWIGRLKAHFPELFFLGEAASADATLAEEYCDPEADLCDAVISFRYFPEKEPTTRADLPKQFLPKSLDWQAFKKTMAQWQQADIYPVLYWNNHDLPRAISRFGDTGKWRERSQMMLAGLMYLQRGLPLLYYGEEIAMQQLVMPEITAFQEEAARDFLREGQEKGYDEQQLLEWASLTSKDASRGAMQWENTDYAGFSETAPWSGVNQEPDFTAASQQNRVTAFYRQLLKLKQTELFIAGNWEMIDTGELPLFGYRRKTKRQDAIVLANHSAETIEYSASLAEASILLANTADFQIKRDHIIVPPFGMIVFKTKGVEK
ncbi:Oligo-1,6-glucosidase [Listeria grayi]|uniref:Oligo-1,6-glucosidase n=1 Tax=Listeria grayi FSL F6-1183 TaxID=1265827 RepID=A0A829R420_LISGR|nr:alpha-glucosidase [Listeria grayi]EUJ25819.1 oligo-1,6-glucosidase [Listeria grayi FSL F6-1183]VEI31461.1 Oligo-1,6-glucosidase [Listeria grayi]